MRKKRKEFSILKWIVFPLNSITLAAIVAYFNITVFGLRDGLPYSIIVVMIGLFSIIINKYTESENRSLAKAAFVFEICLTIALIANATYSISVQRKMSVARMAEAGAKDTITEIGKLKGSRTQREALRIVDKPQSAQAIFANVEDILFWIMCGELALYGLSAFTLFAIAKLMDTEEEAPQEIETAEEFPESLDVSTRTPPRRPNFAPAPKTHVSAEQKKTAKTHASFDPEGLKRLRETLKDISFRLAGMSFKVDVKVDQDAVWIRLMRANSGTQETESSARANLDILDDALTMSRDAFRSRLEKFLRSHGFDI